MTGGDAAAPLWNADVLRPLVAHGTVHGGLRAGPMWQHAARLISPVQGNKDGKIAVDCTRWMNPGTTIEISDGSTVELAIVQAPPKGNEVTLDKVLTNDYLAYRAQVRVLARRPVNLNTARVEVLRALFTNLQLVGKNARITRDEGRTLADLVVESRPFTGFEDFLRRVVLPAAGLEKLPSDAPVVPDILLSGAGFIDPNDALALYRNGLNANDSALLYSTMPYSFNTRDTYSMELRAAVNAPSGVERTSSVRDEVTIIAPQRELLSLWSRQEDWDEVRRLSCGSPWWMSGPRSTTRWEYKGAVPPSFVWAHMGTAQDQPYLPGVTDTTAFANEAAPPVPEHVFPSREDDGFVQLWPARVSEEGTSRRDRVIHFDHETRDPEGRYLPDETVTRRANDKQVGWTMTPSSNPDGSMLRALSFSMWVKPRALADSMFLDVAGTDALADRLSLFIEGQDLVLRVLDGVGDHPNSYSSNFVEATELRYEIAQGNGPGLPIDRWSHIDIDVRGTRPDQVSMLVNGLAHGVRTNGLTRLTANVPQGAGMLPVESTDGFPQYCTVRVGNELIEVETQQNAFKAELQTVGERAGFGGRSAREEYTTTPRSGGPPPAGVAFVPANANEINPIHPSGTTVELYGYSLPIASAVTVGESPSAGIGPFRVAVLDAVVGASSAAGDQITNNNVPLGTFGLGMEGEDSTVNALVLVSADDRNADPNEYMPAFNTDGGYAALVQIEWTVDGEDQTANGTPIGGVEVFRYSGWNGTTLQIAQQNGVTLRGDNIPELLRIPQAGTNTGGVVGIGGRRAFIAHWNPSWKYGPEGAVIETLLDWRTYVVPISLSVPNAAAADFWPPDPNESSFAQITHANDAELTEWVRYDTFELTRQPPQLVRDELGALGDLYRALTLREAGISAGVTPPLPGGGDNPGGPVEHMLAASGGSVSMIAAFAEPAQAQGGPDWSPVIGDNENTDYVISEAAASRFQFRGVFGTFSHQHPANTMIVPVFETYGEEIYGLDRGRPGRLDAAFLVDPSVQSLGFPVRVHRAHIPSIVLELTDWRQTGPAGVASQTAQMQQRGIDNDRVYVALQARAPMPMVPTAEVAAGGFPPSLDTRMHARITMFPSGERPRVVDSVTIGGGLKGSTSSAIPSAVVDEVIFTDAKFGSRKPVGPYDELQGACLVLNDDMSESAKALNVWPSTVRVPGYLSQLGTAQAYLDELPTDGGLLRIGDEILAFNSRDASSGAIGVATNGRGLLGTRAQHHQATEPVSWLESHPVTFLTADASAEAAAFQVADLNDFPSDGTILIGSELIHYTRRSGNSLEMPRASTVAGAMDEKGDGLFRGRFGTVRAGHTAGEAAILFPFRYWDRWAPKADAPELAYFGMSVDQPAGLLSSCFFFKTDGEASQVGVLQRTDPDAPWDADPDTDPRLKLYWKGDNEGQPLLVNQQSDHVDWRIFVQYAPNAFDLATGMSHGWTESPRLQRFGAFHFAPNLVLRSVER
jgi:hypothetical protein